MNTDTHTHEDEMVAEWFHHDKPIDACTRHIHALQQAVKESSAFTFTWKGKDRTFVDATTASMLVRVHAALNPENQAKVEKMIAASKGHFLVLIDRCWQLVK